MELLDGTDLDSDRATMADLLEACLSWTTPRLSPTTVRRYHQIVAVHLVPRLGPVRLRRLTVAMVDRTLSDLQRSGLAPLTVRHIHAVLRRALNQGVVRRPVPRARTRTTGRLLARGNAEVLLPAGGDRSAPTGVQLQRRHCRMLPPDRTSSARQQTEPRIEVGVDLAWRQ
jgi:hypothetical protein